MARIKTRSIKYITAMWLLLALVILVTAFYLMPGKTDYLPKAKEGSVTAPSIAPQTSAPIPTSTPSTSAHAVQGSDTISISSPKQADTITSGTHVIGKVILGKGQLYYRVKGGKSGQLALGPVQVFGNHTVEQNYTFDTSFTNQVVGGNDQGILEVYVVDADGTTTSSATVTVNIQG